MVEPTRSRAPGASEASQASDVGEASDTPHDLDAPVRPSRVLVLADDLIWSTRLVGQVRAAGFEASSSRSAETFRSGLAGADGAIVDLTSRAYDGLAAIAAARDAGVPVLAVGQHDDHVLRRDALAVGADRVLAYRKLFEDGPASIARWLVASGRRPQPLDDPEPTETSVR